MKKDLSPAGQGTGITHKHIKQLLTLPDAQKQTANASEYTNR